MWQRLALAVAALVLIGFIQSVPFPVLDEETYLYIAEQLQPKRPYDWILPWPPYDTEDAFVFAHPPLFLWWIWLLTSWFEFGLGTSKFLAAFPFQVLLGCAAAVLLPRHNRTALFFFCATPIVSLTIARGLMPDLSVSALGAAAMASWWLGEQRKSDHFTVAAGVFIGAATMVKYPGALLFLVPLLHSETRRRMMLCFAAGLSVWLMGEFWLWTIYGRFHLLEVLVRANEISRGPLVARAAGVLIRLSIGAPLILLLAVQRPQWSLVGVIFGAALWWWAALPWALLPLAIIGGAAFLSLVAAFAHKHSESWLATWALVVLIGVIGGHNFAAPRYCLPAMLPLTVLIFRHSIRPFSPLVMGLVGLCSVGLSWMIGSGERRYVRAAAELAETVSSTYTSGYFSGEWTFRYAMRQAGWTFWRGEALCDQHIAVALQAAPAAVSEFWTPIQHWDGDSGSIRLLHAKTSTGYYAETVGKMPLMWSNGPLEQVQLWSSPSCNLQ